MAKMSTVAKANYTTIEVAGREVKLSNPGKVFFPKPGFTKLDLAEYYIAVEEAAVNQLRERPGTMKRFVDGVSGEFFFQKRVPKGAPDWLQTATFTFPSGRTATELVANDAAHLVWAVNLGRRRLQPPSGPALRPRLSRRAPRRPRPDAWGPLEHGAEGRDVREGGARGARSGRLSEDLGLARHPRQRPDRAALGLRRGPPRRAGAGPRGRAAPAAERDQQVVEGGAARRLRRLQPERARPHDRLGLFGQAGPDARVCCPVEWSEVPDVEPADLRLDTVPDRLRKKGDPAADIDEHAGSLDQLLDLARRDEEGGLGDAPWPPHFAKQRGEPKRVQPSPRRRAEGPTPDRSSRALGGP